MNGLIILISVTFVAYFTFTITKTKILKYILPPIVSLLYGFMLFFIGISISGILYYVLAALPVIVVIFHAILLKNKK
ncbi:MAG: hypothetical protein ACREVX_12260 [Clostridium sp.]|uniref:hypothetical protein n=1 Tax=Clostridium sp. TaxID=1506 RepID=UPI003D6D4234